MRLKESRSWKCWATKWNVWMWRRLRNPTTEAPCSPWWGSFSPSSFYNCPENTEYSWSRWLWIFNVTLSPLEQNLFPCSAKPQALFLPPLVLRGVMRCLKGFTAATVHSKFYPWVRSGGKRHVWRQLCDDWAIPHQDWSGILWERELLAVPWLCAGEMARRP